MKVKLNEQGYITDYALIGDLVDGIEIPDPEDLEHFFKNFKAYTIDGFNAEQSDEINKLEQQELYRHQREEECFPIINRGAMWYEMLTEEQKDELRTWYKAWLDVTDTMIIPERPIWLK